MGHPRAQEVCPDLSPAVYARVHTHTHAHTRTHIHSHSHSPMCARAHSCTHTHTHTHSFIHIHIHIHPCVCARARTHVHSFTFIFTHLRACALTHLCAHANPCTHAYPCTHAPMYLCTYACIHASTSLESLRQSSSSGRPSAEYAVMRSRCWPPQKRIESTCTPVLPSSAQSGSDL